MFDKRWWIRGNVPSSKTSWGKQVPWNYFPRRWALNLRYTTIILNWTRFYIHIDQTWMSCNFISTYSTLRTLIYSWLIIHKTYSRITLSPKELRLDRFSWLSSSSSCSMKKKYENHLLNPITWASKINKHLNLLMNIF